MVVIKSLQTPCSQKFVNFEVHLELHEDKLHQIKFYLLQDAEAKH